jgi:hypothetical protein
MIRICIQSGKRLCLFYLLLIYDTPTHIYNPQSYTHINTHTHIYIYINLSHTHTYTHTNTHIHTHTHTPNTHQHTHTYIHTYIHTHTYTHTHQHTYTHIHTHTGVRSTSPALEVRQGGGQETPPGEGSEGQAEVPRGHGTLEGGGDR